MNARTLVISGPSDIHAATRSTMIAQWAAELGVEVDQLVTAGADEFAAALADADDSVDALVIEPGDLAADDVTAALQGTTKPIVAVDLLGPGRPRHDLAAWCEQTIVGRGLAGYRWALRYVRDRRRWPATRIRYGDHPAQWVELRVPAGSGPHPVAVVIHGGSWRGQWAADLMVGVAADLAAHGVASLNVELRLVHTDGGWPATFEDVSAAIDLVGDLADEHHLDTGRIGVVGHSSGGHLALWSAIDTNDHQAPRSTLRPAAVLSLAGVVDLHSADHRATAEGDWAASDFLGGHADERPDAYTLASPIRQLPLGVPLVLVQGLVDGADLIERNHRFAELARAAGDDVEFVALDNVDHFQVIEADHPSWQRARDLLIAALAVPPTDSTPRSPS